MGICIETMGEGIYFGEQVDGTIVTEALAGRRGQ